MGLNIEVEDSKEKKIIHIDGRLDAASTPILEKKLTQLISDGHKFILMNFSKVDYLSSAGMRLLLSATKKLKAIGGKITFCNMSDDVMEIIKMAGFEKILNIYNNENEALEALNPQGEK